MRAETRVNLKLDRRRMTRMRVQSAQRVDRMVQKKEGMEKGVDSRNVRRSSDMRLMRPGPSNSTVSRALRYRNLVDKRRFIDMWMCTRTSVGMFLLFGCLKGH